MINWQTWLQRWDAQQTRYILAREERFEAMLDVCAALLPPDFVALDLACGPAAISRRLLARFPQARVIGLDYNPILLRLGREAVGEDQERAQWIEASLLESEWAESLRAALQSYEQTHVDAVLTTTAMHWLPPDALTRVYAHLGALVREKGVYLDGDHLAFPPNLPTFRKLVRQVKEHEAAAAFAQPDSETYAQWWAALLSDLRAHAPEYDDLIAGYERSETARVRGFSEPILALHEAALLNAGFTEISTVWQRWDDRVLLAIKGAATEG